MKKKEKIIVLITTIVVLAFAVVMYSGLFKQNKDAEYVYVNRGRETIGIYDLSEDATYTFEVINGHMTLEIKDQKFRVIDVDCPNHLCESIGWVDIHADTDDIMSIMAMIGIKCVPNGVEIGTITQKELDAINSRSSKN